jgi:hypothetical protein
MNGKMRSTPILRPPHRITTKEIGLSLRGSSRNPAPGLCAAVSRREVALHCARVHNLPHSMSHFRRAL